MTARRITLHIPPRLLERMQLMADRHRLPVNEIMLELLAVGLFDLEECDRYEEMSLH